MATERYTHSFNVLISPRQADALDDLSEELHCSRAHVVRQLLDKGHGMIIHHTPFCADGSRCLVPHLHRPHDTAADAGPRDSA